VAALAAALLAGPPARAQTPSPTQVPPRMEPPPEPATQHVDPGPFAKGQKRFAFVGGYASAYGDDYLFIGAGAGVFVADGLDVGVDMEAWFLGQPTIYKLSPQIRYTYWKPIHTKPYVGAFYRRTFVVDFQDADSVGGRGGIYYEGDSGTIVGGGVVYERFLDCDNALGDCDELYPEFVFALSF
jgi:hypothetical protein